MSRENKKQWTLTIAPELHETWKNSRRIGDPEALAEVCNVSRPVIDRALIYGYVSVEGLVDKINTYFEERLLKERTDAERINGLTANKTTHRPEIRKKSATAGRKVQKAKKVQRTKNRGR